MIILLQFYSLCTGYLFRISYKILLLAYKALNGLAPAYLTSLLSCYDPTRSLKLKNSGLLVVSRTAKSTKGGRTFSYLEYEKHILYFSYPISGIAFLITFGVQTHSLCLNHISLAKHSYNASHNLVLQLYLIKHTLLCFSLG